MPTPESPSAIGRFIFIILYTSHLQIDINMITLNVISLLYLAGSEQVVTLLAEGFK